jgi:hypothetical protein
LCKETKSGEKIYSSNSLPSSFSYTFTADENFNLYLNGFSNTDGVAFIECVSNF